MRSVYESKGGIAVTDQEILDLFWKREERALEETETQYGTYCRSIAWNILRNRQSILLQ